MKQPDVVQVLRGDLEVVIDYLWHDEQQHYSTEPPQERNGHVLGHLGRLKAAIDATVGRNPHIWTEEQIAAAFGYFNNFYATGGIFHENFFAGQPPVTRDEFMRAVLADYDDTMAGKTEHLLFGFFTWEWATIERERVRDRVLQARGCPRAARRLQEGRSNV